MSKIQFRRIHLKDTPYQSFQVPNGSAPLGVEETDEGFDLIYIGPNLFESKANSDVGCYLVKGGEDIPDGVLVLPTPNELLGIMLPPNARYIDTLSGDRHVVLGDPKLTSGQGLVV